MKKINFIKIQKSNKAIVLVIYLFFIYTKTIKKLRKKTWFYYNLNRNLTSSLHFLRHKSMFTINYLKIFRQFKVIPCILDKKYCILDMYHLHKEDKE